MKELKKSIPRPFAAVPLALLTASFLGVGPMPARAQFGDFQIVWVLVGEAASADWDGSSRAGRQLFVQTDLMSKTMRNVKVAKVEVEPVVIELGVGEQLCLSSLHIRAFSQDQEPIPSAPMSIAVRQDHKERLRLQRSKKDICVRPSEAGEYPVRLTSLLPAQDGTMRGAQVFLRASDP